MNVYLHYYENSNASECLTCCKYTIENSKMTLNQLLDECAKGFNKKIIDKKHISIKSSKSSKKIEALNMYVKSFFEEGSDIFFVYETKQASVPQQVEIEQLLEKQVKFEPITKYTFFDANDKWAKFTLVFIELPGIEKLLKSQIKSRFFEQSFEIQISDYKGKNINFAVSKTQCKLNAKDSTVTTKDGKLTIWIRKIKKEDNWFSLYKTKTIGGNDSD